MIKGSYLSWILSKTYYASMRVLNAFCPRTWAHISYYHAYRKRCNLKNPKTFSEKLLWLWLNDYSSNKMIHCLGDKYLVRKFVKKRGCGGLLNELYFRTNDISKIEYKKLPDSFVLKRSLGWNTNLICKDKRELTPQRLKNTLRDWKYGQLLYDISASKTAGLPIKKLHTSYICEKYLGTEAGETPADYKIYCFDGEPLAILYITGRFETKTGVFMSTEWVKLNDLGKNYVPMETLPQRPESLPEMIDAAKKLSKGFPFVRVDLYDYNGKAIFGEMTFFPSGCVGMQETEINGKGMAEYLNLNRVRKESCDK